MYMNIKAGSSDTKEDIDTVVIQFVNTVSDETELTTLVVYNRIVKILRREKSKQPNPLDN